jgi:hypothetical protein
MHGAGVAGGGQLMHAIDMMEDLAGVLEVLKRHRNLAGRARDISGLAMGLFGSVSNRLLNVHVPAVLRHTIRNHRTA